MDFLPLFGDVIRRLEAVGVDYVVVGSMAASAWGVVRTTYDADVVVLATADSATALIAELDQADDLYHPEVDVARAVEHGGSFNVLHLKTGGKVDVFLVPASDRFTQSRIARRVRAEVFGIEVWVATPEDVVLAKLRWRLDSRSERQWQDCCDLAAANDLDEGYLREWGAELGIEADLSELLLQAAN